MLEEGTRVCIKTTAFSYLTTGGIYSFIRFNGENARLFGTIANSKYNDSERVMVIIDDGIRYGFEVAGLPGYNFIKYSDLIPIDYSDLRLVQFDEEREVSIYDI